MTDETMPMTKYITTASRADRVLAFGHASDLDAARVWCEQARDTYFELADQVAVATLQEVQSITGGMQPVLIPVEAWTKSSEFWVAVPMADIHLNFDELPPGPTAVADLRLAQRSPEKRQGTGSEHADTELQRVASLLVHLSHGVRGLAAATRARRPTRKRVLIVDDDKLSRMALRHALSSRHDVAEAETFAAALLELAMWDFDAVVSDYHLGTVGKGTDLLAEVRSRWPGIHRVLCTSAVVEVQEAVSDGVAHHLLSKPVDRAALLASLSTR